MSSQSVVTSSRVWSCATFEEGVAQVRNTAARLEDEELELEKEIQARFFS